MKKEDFIPKNDRKIFLDDNIIDIKNNFEKIERNIQMIFHEIEHGKQDNFNKLKKLTETQLEAHVNNFMKMNTAKIMEKNIIKNIVYEIKKDVESQIEKIAIGKVKKIMDEKIREILISDYGDDE